MNSENWQDYTWVICRGFGRPLFLVLYLYFRFPELPWLYGTSMVIFPLLLDIVVFILMNLSGRSVESQIKLLENALISCLDMGLMLNILLITPGIMHVHWGWVIAFSIGNGIASMVFNTSVIRNEDLGTSGSGSTTRKHSPTTRLCQREETTKNEKAMASQEQEEAKEEENAGRRTRNPEKQVQELEAKKDGSLKTLFNQQQTEKEPDLAASELNCQRDDDDNQEPRDLLEELHLVLQLYEEKEREYGELIEKCKQKKIELGRKFLDWLLRRGTSSAEYYRGLYIDYYDTCRKSMEENATSPAEKLCSKSTASPVDDECSHNIVDLLEHKCRLLEEDKENLAASLRAANAAVELYRGYLHDSTCF